MFAEREYQELAQVEIFKAWEKEQSTLLELATGLGKTVVACNIINAVRPKRTMFLAHRDELVRQTKEAIENNLRIGVDVEQADQFASTSLFDKTPVVVSTIQTQCSGPKGARRYKRFNPQEFGLLVVDEVHHSTAPTWRETIDHYCTNPNLKVLGLSATPRRTDDEALRQVIKSVAFRYGIKDGINDGWLVDLVQEYVSVGGLDFSHIETNKGDFNEAQLSKLMEMEENIQGVCQPSLERMFGLAPKTLSTVPVNSWREYLAGLNRRPRRTIMFTVSVAQAEMCASIFSRAMTGFEWVCGETNKEKRREILKRFLSGDIYGVANCGVLTEGYNNPFVELIIGGRPTKSTNLYTQMIGRGTRPLPGVVDDIPEAWIRVNAIKQSAKPLLYIMDFVGNSGRHKLVSTLDVLGGHVTKEAAELAKQRAMEGGKPVRIMATINNAQAELERQAREKAELERQRKEAEKRRLLAKVEFRTTKVDAFGNGGPRIPLKFAMSKDGKQFSEPQLKILREAGCEPNRLGYKQGQAIIGKQIAKWKKERGQ